jgi:choline dehydrogenase-like flavoprotein
MQETFRELLTHMGGQIFSSMPTREQGYGIATGGSIIHETGGTRMGNDPSKSVVNKFGQAHEVKNLFVADGGPFVSQADKNPTWTILALSWRLSDYIVEQRRQGAL